MGEIGATKIAGGALAPIKSNYDGTEPESSNEDMLKIARDFYEQDVQEEGERSVKPIKSGANLACILSLLDPI